MKIGYIRVSRDKQVTLLKEDALKREECVCQQDHDRCRDHGRDWLQE
ncbi:MAG TPA: hypothetical protein VED37_12565 [Ktedonobacteraceae bacterium]|nr:hypothetical protein [Ktedonobacteraceae bacterium]